MFAFLSQLIKECRLVPGPYLHIYLRRCNRCYLTVYNNRSQLLIGRWISYRVTAVVDSPRLLVLVRLVQPE